MEFTGKQPEASPEKDIAPIVLAHWTNSRKSILAWLNEQAPSLAELYESAVCLMFETRLPSRVRLVSHCGREICNRLLVLKLEEKSRGRLDYVKRMDEIAKLWEKKRFHNR